ncbi:ATP-binding protein [Angustibacter peucedani]
MRAADLRGIALFDGLDDDQLGQLLERGSEVRVEPGVVLFHEGEHADDWWVLVDGALELTRRSGSESAVVGRMDTPGRWAGGFRAWDEHGVYLATGRGVHEGRVLRVPSPALRELSTAWFPFGAHLVEGLYGTARAIEQTARQRDALVTLGTLAAGLAHELNNPAAAATRAVASLEATCRTLLESLGHLAQGDITADQFTALDALRRDVVPRTGQDDARDPLARIDQEEALQAWLERRAVREPWQLAPVLVQAGADVAWCERAALVLPEGALEAGLRWVASTYAAVELLGQVKESTRRVSELVDAVRSYSQMDRGAVQRIDVTEGIESTLVMLGHQLRGITVERDYGADVPEVEAFAGELNQVWTNLVDNAVDAMDGSGTLRLTTRADGDHVVVEVADTGAGMPPEVAARAFEAFFTTKDVGRGTGLGLDIARRAVVERHGGTIEITSQPGETVVRVRLPLRARPRS